MPQHEKDRVAREAKTLNITTNALPFRSAAMVGCALAVQKKHFYDIGAFDPGMNVWGGENIEVAMRNWMCGGEVHQLSYIHVHCILYPAHS